MSRRMWLTQKKNAPPTPLFDFGIGCTTQRPGDEAGADFSQPWHSVVTVFVLSQVRCHHHGTRVLWLGC